MLDPKTRQHISAILPAYNEARNIRTVLEVLHKSDFLDEIILVDDGSSDETLLIMLEFVRQDNRMHLLRHTRNEGKGQAIFTGWKAASGTVLLLLDSDLKNLTPGHLRALLAPVLDHRADMTLGLFWGGHIHTDLAHWGAPFLTGQRALRARIMNHVSYEAARGYGFEIALTVAASQYKYSTRIVPMSGVWHPPSEFHRGGWNGVKWRARMYIQILRALWVATCERYPQVVEFFSSILKS